MGKCVKALRMHDANTNHPRGSLVVRCVREAPARSVGADIANAFLGGAAAWKGLKHPDVVPFLGVATAPSRLVSEWMPNGTLTECVNTNPGADGISLVCNGQGHARVSDFGLASIAHGKYSTGVKPEKGYSVR